MPSKPDVEQSLPFGPDVLVLKTNGKIFLLIPLDADSQRFNAKCDPERAEQLRSEYAGILPGYHYFIQDREKLHRSIETVLQLRGKRYWVGHGGPFTHSAIARWYERVS